MATRHETRSLRLYLKTPGSGRLRKGAAAELRHLLAHGWQEVDRRTGFDHVIVRIERPAGKVYVMPLGRSPRPPRR